MVEEAFRFALAIVVLVIFSGLKTSKHKYHSILQRHTIPSGMKLCGRGFVLQQDNDPKHTSHPCKNYLTKKEQKGDLVVMDFPPQSPDLNPIEHLWEHVKRENVKCNPTSLNNLWDVLNHCWNNMQQTVLRKLVYFMPSRVDEVLKAKGEHKILSNHSLRLFVKQSFPISCSCCIFLAIATIVLCENTMCIHKRENLVDWTQTFEHHCRCRKL